MEQLSIPGLVSISAQEDYKQVMKELSSPCEACRLGAVLHPGNRGIIWRGSLEARIAVLSEAPGDNEMENGLPLVGRSGKMWETWADYIEIDTKTDTFISNIVQCQPDKVLDPSTNRWAQRPPAEDEISACFGPRSLRVLHAMPRLEVVLTLGWVAARAVLGGEPNSKTHENKWFTTSLFPTVPVFCMVHPAFIVREPTQEKRERVMDGLKKFKREYLETRKVLDIVQQMNQSHGQTGSNH